MKKILFVTYFFLFPIFVFSQKKYTEEYMYTEKKQLWNDSIISNILRADSTKIEEYNLLTIFEFANKAAELKTKKIKFYLQENKYFISANNDLSKLSHFTKINKNKKKKLKKYYFYCLKTKEVNEDDKIIVTLGYLKP